MASNAQRLQFLLAQGDGFTRSRLPALYSDFHTLRSTNPEGYAANVGAWRRALVALVRGGLLPAGTTSSASGAASASATTAARNFLVLTAGPPLLDALESDRYGRPLVLYTVVDDAVRDGDLVPLAAFFEAQESLYARRSSQRSWKAWAAALPWQALSWGVRQVVGDMSGGGGGGGSGTTGDFVVVANVEAAAGAFAERTADLRSPFERTWSVAHFKRLFSRPGALLGTATDLLGPDAPRLSDTDLDVLLKFLVRDKNTVAYDGKVVRLRGSGDSSHGDDITDEDRAVAQVRELIDTLTHQTTVLSRRVDDLTAAAREAAAGGPKQQQQNRVAALAALRQRKQVEAVLATRFATLAQLEGVAAQLEQAADQVQVVQAMASSAEALATLHAQVGGASGAGDVAARLRQEMDAADEIGRILAEPEAVASDGVVVDESEIDDELAALEREEAEKKIKTAGSGVSVEETTRQRLAAAGAVPQTAPGQTTATKEDKDADAALEAATTESLRNLSLKDGEGAAEPAK